MKCLVVAAMLVVLGVGLQVQASENDGLGPDPDPDCVLHDAKNASEEDWGEFVKCAAAACLKGRWERVGHHEDDDAHWDIHIHCPS